MSLTIEAETIEALLQRGHDAAPCLHAPGRSPMTYRHLRELVSRTRQHLAAMGIGRCDRVAIVLPNGPEMAACFVAVACAAATAPLNPGYRREDFEASLADLRPAAIVVLQGWESSARTAAITAGIAVIELVPGEIAGDFLLKRPPHPSLGVAPLEPAAASDIALLLHTSGTTSRPKLVPLRHGQVCASARNIGVSLALDPSDCCLNVMPLFHIHGLVAALLASLAAGASVCCTEGFNAFRFFGTLESERPTWLTAVPTMLQSLLGLAERNAAVIAASRLRLIRSSSASLPPQVMQALEAAFAVPVIESYGMTEAAHQMASNQLPPGLRHPGSVGVAAGPEIAIMDPQGAILAPNEIGEVVIRGPNVTDGYVDNPAANATSFTNGWFRTGDQGALDRQGTLRLTGRLKEIINRGGEKISPLEVDDVLMDHPAIAQVVTFAAPHAQYGEEVAAAVVLRHGHTTSEQAVRQFAASRLAAYKVPSRVVFLTEIPKGVTGKLQRIGLAATLGII